MEDIELNIVMSRINGIPDYADNRMLNIAFYSLLHKLGYDPEFLYLTKVDDEEEYGYHLIVKFDNEEVDEV